MKEKRMIFKVMLLVIIVVIVAIFIMFKSKFVQVEITNSTENTVATYIPEAEITDEQLKMTKVKLFFEDENGNLVEEEREINIKELVNNPYKSIIQELINGPKKENNKRLIPDGTTLLEVEKVENCLEISFSKEFINNCNTDKKIQEKIVKSIYFSLTELREIESIKILIDGKEVKSFNDNGYNLSGVILFE